MHIMSKTSPKRWFGNMNMTSKCDVTNSAQQYKWTPYATEWKTTVKNFCVVGHQIGKYPVIRNGDRTACAKSLGGRV